MTRSRCSAWLPQAGTSARTLVSHRLRSCSAVYPIAPCTCSAARAASAAASAQATFAAETSRAAVAASVGDRRGGRVEQRTGELQPDRHVRQLVLDRLECPHRLAELGTQRPRGARWPRAARGPRRAAARNRPAPPCRTRGPPPRPRRGPLRRARSRRTASGPGPPTGAWPRPWPPGRRPPRRAATSPAASASAANGSRGGTASVAIRSPAASPASHSAAGPRRPARATPPGRPPSSASAASSAGHGREGLRHRSRHRVMTEFRAGGHEVRRAGAEPAPLLRHGERGDPETGEPPPQRQPGSPVAVGPPPRGRRHVGRGEHVVQGRGELAHLGQSQQPLGDHRALDLVRARVDRARQGEQVALEPAVAAQLGARPEQVQRRLVQRQVELGPEHLAQARLGPERPAVGEPGGGRLRVQLIRARPDPRVGDPVRAWRCRPGRRPAATARPAGRRPRETVPGCAATARVRGWPCSSRSASRRRAPR